MPTTLWGQDNFSFICTATTKKLVTMKLTIYLFKVGSDTTEFIICISLYIMVRYNFSTQSFVPYSDFVGLSKKYQIKIAVIHKIGG